MPTIRLVSIEQLLFIVIVEVVQARFWRTLCLYNVLGFSEDLLVKNDEQVFFIHWNYTSLGVNLLLLLPELLMEHSNGQTGNFLFLLIRDCVKIIEIEQDILFGDKRSTAVFDDILVQLILLICSLLGSELLQRGAKGR